MTPEQYEHVRRIFLAARETSGRQREDLLDEMCDDDGVRSEVESLLANDEQAETFLQTPALGEEFAVGNPESLAAGTGALRSGAATADGSAAATPADAVPRQIGQYTILDVLGQGGMGVVYRARQDKPRRTVALKVIKPGIESREALRRFEHESQMLGRLQHPGIAQVYEAGTADTGRGRRPFFAMEFVDGLALVEYASRRLLDVRRRLELMVRVCDAVQHAHQKGLIHRDLKPGNVLVVEDPLRHDGAGQPKILDFGVARATGADIQVSTMQTAAGQLVGTLAYMSPEQIEGDPDDLDTRSDVYSLGVILFELLSGRVPTDVSRMTLPQAARAIVEDEAPLLGSLNRAYHGDVETIVAKALEKERDRRYQSASDLAEDIRRYLSDQPIAARPVTTVYQLRKFAKRNKALVGGVLVAFLALLIGVVGTTSQAVRATRQRNRALEAESLAAERMVRIQAEADKSKAINEFLNQMLASVDPGRDGRDVRVAEVLDRAAATVAGEMSDQPEIQTSLQNTIGATYIRLGLWAEAEPHLRAALATRQRLLGEEDRETLTTANNLAAALKELGQLPEAEALIRKALHVWRRDLGTEHPWTLSAMNKLADVLQKQGEVAEAESLWRDVLTGQRRLLEPDDPQLAVTLNNLAQLLKQLRRPADAEVLLREALELQLAATGEEHPLTLAAMNNLAMTLKAQEKYDEAGTLLRQVVAVRRRTLGDNPLLFVAVSNLARLVTDQGRLGDAEPLAREALDGFRRTLGHDNPKTLLALNNLASLLVDLGRANEAEALYADLLETARSALPEGHWMALVFQRNYGRCLTALQRYEQAEELLVPSYDGLEASLGPRHEQTHKTLQLVIDLYRKWDKPEALAAWQARSDPPPHP